MSKYFNSNFCKFPGELSVLLWDLSHIHVLDSSFIISDSILSVTKTTISLVFGMKHPYYNVSGYFWHFHHWSTCICQSLDPRAWTPEILGVYICTRLNHFLVIWIKFQIVTIVCSCIKWTRPKNLFYKTKVVIFKVLKTILVYFILKLEVL
jgi:hypothetical protein